MGVIDFFNKIKVTSSREYFYDLIKSGLDNENNEFTLFKRQSDKLSSNIDKSEYQLFLQKIINMYKKTGGDIKNISSIINSHEGVAEYNYYKLNNINKMRNRTHKFTINLSGASLYQALNEMIDKALSKDYNFDIVIPSVSNQSKGLTDTITLYSSTEDLLLTLNFLDSLEKTDKMAACVVNGKAKYKDYISYDSYDIKTGLFISDTLNNLVKESFKNVITSSSHANPDLKIVGMNIIDYCRTNNFNYESIKRAVQAFLAKKIDIVFLVTEEVMKKLNDYHINPENIFLNDNAKEEIVANFIDEHKDETYEVDISPVEIIYEEEKINEVNEPLETTPLDPEFESLLSNLVDDQETLSSNYDEKKVDVSPIEEKLTNEEAKAYLQTESDTFKNNQEKLKDMNLDKYSFIPNKEELLVQEITNLDGGEITLYDYFEKENLLDKIPVNSHVIYPDASEPVKASEFISTYLIRLLTVEGAVDLEELMNIREIKVIVEKEKKGLFDKILKKKSE